MKMSKGKILLSAIISMGLFLSIIITVTGDISTISDISISPSNPTPQSVVSFSVDVHGDSVSAVRLIIRECNKKTGLCHVPRNISMNDVGDNSYEAEVELKQDDVDSMTYQLIVKSDGTWTQFDEHTKALSIKKNNNSNSNGTPGFEIILFFIAILAFLLIKRGNQT
jgi:hypothetical protein